MHGEYIKLIEQMKKELAEKDREIAVLKAQLQESESFVFHGEDLTQYNECIDVDSMNL